MSFKKIIQNPFVIAFLFGILGLHLVREMANKRFSPPPALIEVPTWSLQDQSGLPFGSKELAGKVVIASFFFTRCPTVCPKLAESMTEVRKRFLDQLDKAHFVSISIDPEFDTPPVLAAYQAKNRLDWTFLTGSKTQILDVVEAKMKLPIGEGHHVAELVLFDQKGDLRAKFGTDPRGLAALTQAAKYFIDNPTR